MRVVLLALLVTFAACGKKKEGGESSSTKTTETKSADTPPADPTMPPPSAPAAASAVDPCEFVTTDQIKTLLGADPEPAEKNAATGSMLGGCNWRDKDFKTMLSVQARPAGELEATAKYAKNQKEIPGLGEKAYMTDAGIMVQPAGKPYFLHVMAMAGGQVKQDEAKATELAKLAVAGAK